jgi:molybdenum cofactor cytidylyltransferase
MTQYSDLAAILLAAGFSRRMGGENKLLKPLGGKPLIGHALETVAGLGLGQVIAVLGEAAEAIAPLLPETATPLRHKRAMEGMGASLAAGAALLRPGLTGAFVVLADMPFVERGDYERLVAAFRAEEADAICVPLHQGQRGHPVLFPARCFAELAALRGDSGARHLLTAPGAKLRMVAGCSPGVIADFDDLASFAAYEAGRSAGS